MALVFGQTKQTPFEVFYDNLWFNNLYSQAQPTPNPCSCMSISKKNLLYSEKYRSRSVDCVLIAIKEIMKEKFH